MNTPCTLWPSPLSPETVAAGARLLAEPQVGREALYWLAGLPEEGGRTTLMRKRGDEAAHSLLPSPYNARSRVNEYGGGAYTVTPAGEAWFVNGDDQALCRVRGETIERVFQADDLALGDLAWDNVHGRVLAVGEALAGTPRQKIGRAHV